MITAKMMGNLGNQLFIYAFARALQLQYNDDLIIDLSGLKRYYYTADYKLNHFNINNNILYDIKKLNFSSRIKYRLSSKVFHLEQYFYNKIKKSKNVPNHVTKRWFKRGCYYYTNRLFYNYPETKRKNKYLYGYFQGEQYFNKYEKQIRNELRVKDELSEYESTLIDQMSKCNSIGVSIRANKAPENPKVKDNILIGFIKKEFYYEGMKSMAEKVENPVFYIFADDIEEVKKSFTFPYPVIYVTPESAVSGLRLLYNCKHFVITNSTFAWWGAYLGNNPDKKIIMPTPWDRIGILRESIYFKDAERIKCEFEKE